MFTKGYSRLVILCSCVMLAGCATSRSEIKIHSPAIVAPATTATSAQHVVVIGRITDERVFEDDPGQPSTPSLGFGGTANATDELKTRAIARKRNSYGKALGDVVLQSGQTVESVIRENLTAAFQQAGYQVKGAGDAGTSPLVVDVRIKEFWAWFDPGFWAITLNENIVTDLVVNGMRAPVVVSAHVEEKRQAATDDAWINIVDKGLGVYRVEVTNRMRGSDGANMAAAAMNAPANPYSAEPTTTPANDSPATEAVAVSAPTAVATEPMSGTATSTQGSVADTAITPLAQSVATELGCGAVQANNATTFIAPCDGYSVLIDCDGGQCRPMHTVNVKKDD